MKKKIYWNIWGIALTAVFLSFILSSVMYYQKNETQARQQIRAEVHYLKEGLDLAGMEYLKVLSNHLESNASNRITLISAAGQVLYDSHVDLLLLDNHDDREEVKQAKEYGSGEAVRSSETLLERTYYYALQLRNGDVIRGSSTIKGIAVSLYQLLPGMLAVIFITGSISMGVAEIQTKRIVRPINELNFDHPEQDYVYEEMAPFQRRIQKQNAMLQKQMERLEDQKKEFRAITEHMQEGFLVINRNEIVVSYNISALRILGLEDKNNGLSGSHILKFNRDGEFYQAVEAALKGHHAECLLTLNNRKYQMIANPVKDHQSYNGAIVIIIDITEAKQREDLRREFSANVSHELKTPLTSISGYAELLKDGLVKAEDIGRFAETIYVEAKRMIAMVEDIMQLSRLDEGEHELPKDEVDLLVVAQRAAARRKKAAAAKEIALIITGESVMVYGAETILEEIVTNLCDNAIKYNRPHGQVTISVSKVDGSPTLCVTDTGIGIAEADRERIFERFYRVDKSHSKKIEGTGLGLSIVKRGVLYHHAQLELESKEDEGTSITIRFNQQR